ncbi:hypothetical protein ACN47E_010066 [Coniothyrium glycines]
MAPSKVVLYDLPSVQGTAWSLNPWKTRMILNYKGIDYQTDWVEYPDLAPKFESWGIPPNPKDAPGYFADYSSPAIKYDDGTLAMDSWPIALELEKRYPSPSLHLDNPIVLHMRDHTALMMRPIFNRLAARIPLILPERSAEYFHETREKIFGKSVEQLEAEAKESDWASILDEVKRTGDLLRKNDGPFFLGETVSYADFIFVSMLQFFKRINNDVFERFIALDPAFPKVFEACKPWLAKED